MTTDDDNLGERLINETDDVEADSNSNKIQGMGFQIYASLIANLIAVTDGMTMGWTSPMIPYFLSEQSHIKMSRTEAEWIETSSLLGSVFGLPITAYLVSRIGRKKSIMLACFLLILCWLLIAFTNQVSLIYIARFGKGLGLNMGFVAMPMYIGEISHKRIRGLLTASIFIFMLVGILIIYSMGPYLPYIVPPMIAVTVLFIELVAFFFLPESPYHLLVTNKNDQARKSLQWLRAGCNIENEFKELQTAMNKAREEKGGVKDLIKLPNNRRALIITMILNFSQLFGSFEVILMNLHEILTSAGSIYLTPSTTAILFAFIMLIFAAISSSLIDKVGRKVILAISTFTSSTCLLVLAIYFTLQSRGCDLRDVSWIPIVAVMSYAACFKFGLGTVPIVITAEIFSQRIKAVGITLADGVYVISSIAALQVFFCLKAYYGMYAPFYVFSGCLFAVLPFFIFCVPETKGKSLDEIQKTLSAQKFL